MPRAARTLTYACWTRRIPCRNSLVRAPHADAEITTAGGFMESTVGSSYKVGMLQPGAVALRGAITTEAGKRSIGTCDNSALTPPSMSFVTIANQDCTMIHILFFYFFSGVEGQLEGNDGVLRCSILSNR